MPPRCPVRVEPDTGWLEGADRRPTPNRDARPPDAGVNLVVVHAISLPPGEFGGAWIDDLFLNRLDPQAHPYFRDIADLRVSAHALIRRDGSLTQYAGFGERAWHAGESCWEGRAACNDYAVGVELEGSDEQGYEPVQYRRLAELIRALMRVYPAITPERVVGHCHVAPGRKTDPGPHFDWARLKELLNPGNP